MRFKLTQQPFSFTHGCKVKVAVGVGFTKSPAHVHSTITKEETTTTPPSPSTTTSSS
ncbi:hypothetical protein A2U01_0046374 [Trifolium medium]|uniref:Uncharacterized protein n=1 Tax=Trifolium medium TaxID=97028 RepID=A0A392QPJ3_9FABA|nr:hypothetical protein [Trifolium medium]